MNYVPYNAKLWQRKTLANLVNQTPLTNILPSQIPDSLKYVANVGTTVYEKRIIKIWCLDRHT